MGEELYLLSKRDLRYKINEFDGLKKEFLRIVKTWYLEFYENLMHFVMLISYKFCELYKPIFPKTFRVF